MKLYTLLLLLLLCTPDYAQEFEDQWTGYFSYLDIKDISVGNNRLFVAAQNAIFNYDPVSQTNLKTDAINGLEGSNISAIYYSDAFGLTLVGYDNGLIQVILENNGQILTVVDIFNKLTIAPDNKRINHFLEYEDKVFISTEFGIAEYNLANLEFGDSFFIGENGSEIEVSQTAVLGSKIYASTLGGAIRSVDINNPNIIDFDEWETLGSSSWKGIVNYNGRLFAISNTNGFFEIVNNSFNLIRFFTGVFQQLRVDEEKIIVVTDNSVFILNNELNEIGLVNSLNDNGTELDINFTSASILNDILFVGDSELGLLQIEDFNSGNFSVLSPDGPILNRVFSITRFEDELWLAFGEYSQLFDPFPLNGRGVSHFTGENWSNLTFDDIQQTREIADITIDINNPNRVYLSSYIDGLLILENEEVIEILNGTNSGLANTVDRNGDPQPGDTRVGAAAFDNLGNLYISNSITENPLKRLSGNSEINAVDLSEVFIDPFRTSSAKVIADNSGNIYLATAKLGLFGYQPLTGNVGKIASDIDGVDLPEVFEANPAITAMEFDNNNRMWIGTAEGLRVAFNPQAMFEEDSQLNVSPIIFLENGVAQELLFQQFITDIKTDGAGNIWISTADSGVFQVNSTGQEILNVFNQDNSPLPSNSVISIEINGETGEVYFGTNRGLVSYQSRITDGVDNLENVRVFPNPVRPQYSGVVTVDGLTDNANVKITDITGNLVYEEFASGGTVQWDTRAFGKHKVASGVYMVIITSEDQIETKTTKIMIIR